MMKESVAVICKCSNINKLFGIRFDRKNNFGWEYAWAFPLKDGADKREKGFSTVINGSIEEGKEYNGCPHCGNKGFFRCSCGKLSCWNGRDKKVHCNHCGQYVVLEGTITEIDATGSM